MTAAIRPDNSVQYIVRVCLHARASTKRFENRYISRCKNAANFYTKKIGFCLAYIKNKWEKNYSRKTACGRFFGCSCTRVNIYFFSSLLPCFRAKWVCYRHRQKHLRLRHLSPLLTYSYYTMLGSRIKKKMLLNYSFCRIFYFLF